MTLEQLKRAQEIQSLIEDLKIHKSQVEKVRLNIGYFRMDSPNDTVKFKEKYCPISPELFANQYVQNLDDKIKELEEEFKTL